MNSTSELHGKISSDSRVEQAGRFTETRTITPIWRRRRLRLAMIALLAVLLCAVLAYWLVERWTHVFLDDARITANLVAVSSEVSGRVTKVRIIGGDAVKKGTLLVAIGQEQAELDLAVLESQIAGISRHQDQLRAQQKMIRLQVASRLEAGEAEILAAEASHGSAEAVLQNARSYFDRVKAMSATNIVAAQEFDQAQANLTTAEQEKRLALARIATARANLAVTEAERSQIDVLERQIEMLEAEKSAKLAEADRKRIDIARFVITADFDGVIDSTFVDAGEYVSPGTRLFMYHDPNSVWVDANVKETHFNRVMLGAPARVTVDAYPGRAFTGKVIRLGEAATSQFALLPTPNPSGNFTKITQRLPIRIAVDQQDGLLRPGMMVEVSIDVVD